ncbi:MAG: GGDEF domain-containing protein [Clostridiales bacterium]|nr:GGDEF domain-containing protein [Clostridiales bacterium]
MERRLNIGLLVDDINNHFAASACRGAELGSKALGANLFIFPGHYIGEPDPRIGNKEYDHQYNTIYTLANETNIDVLYVLLGSIGSRASKQLQKEFLNSLPHVPIVTLFMKSDGFRSFTFDNVSGTKRALKHLIEKHNAGHIGYVSGPMTNSDAVERLQAFRDAMNELGAEINEARIVEGDFTEMSDDVVGDLLDRNHDLDAILFANDSMAVGGYRAMLSRGIVPGEDIMVAGFDNDPCSIELSPKLTTIEASSAELVYNAVLHAEELINNTEADDFKVDTFLVQRSSCGCDGLNLEDMVEHLRLKGDQIHNSALFASAAEHYIFGVYSDDQTLKLIKNEMATFHHALLAAIADGLPDGRCDDLAHSFGEVFKYPVLSYTTPERLYNVLQTLKFRASSEVSDADSRVRLAELFAEFYRRLSDVGLSVLSGNRERLERISHIGNVQSGLLMTAGNPDIQYHRLLYGFDMVGIRRSYLYAFQSVINNPKGSEWKLPKSILLKAYKDEDGLIRMLEEQELIRTEQIMTNEHIKKDRRLTMVASPLFVGEDLYGILVNELDTGSLASVTPVALQISISLRIINMLEEEGTLRRNLEESLEQFKRDNKTLSVQSKSDELTGLYNRRGFLEHSRRIISAPENLGKNALVCYADMDDLKMINDVYGHDEGDFALREIAAILNDAFRHTDIIGRFGGDEFVACAIVGIPEYEEKIKKRITDITKRHNKNAGKPYPIEMSVGVHEFICGPDEDIYVILEKADEKLYAEKKAKKKGRGTYRDPLQG